MPPKPTPRKPGPAPMTPGGVQKLSVTALPEDLALLDSLKDRDGNRSAAFRKLCDEYRRLVK